MYKWSILTMENFDAIYNMLSYILTSLGMFMILKKCHDTEWYGLIPGVRWYRISIQCGRTVDGIGLLFTEIASTALSIVRLYTDPASNMYMAAVFVGLAVLIMRIIFEIRVVIGLCRLFDLKKRWVLFWLALPGLAAVTLGFMDKYQPVALGTFEKEEVFAGLRPASLSAAVDDDDSDDGLVIHVRSRTVRTLRKKRYLLQDINLTIPNGKLVLLLGGSGSGKTTLVNAITGYEKANAIVKLNGENIYTNYKEMKYRIGFVPQQDLLRMNDTVIETLEDAAKLRLPTDIRKEEREKLINGVIDTLGLTGRQDGLVSKKSGGQKKRISIGTELISNPDLFILDEPDSGLDGVIARELFTKLRGIADEGKIVIAITHTPDRVIDLFDRVIVLARDSGKVGRLAFYGTPAGARKFFGKDTMEGVVMSINNKEEGGEGRADEFIEKYARLTAYKGVSRHE